MYIIRFVILTNTIISWASKAVFTGTSNRAIRIDTIRIRMTNITSAYITFIYICVIPYNAFKILIHFIIIYLLGSEWLWVLLEWIYRDFEMNVYAPLSKKFSLLLILEDVWKYIYHGRSTIIAFRLQWPKPKHPYQPNTEFLPLKNSLMMLPFIYGVLFVQLYKHWKTVQIKKKGSSTLTLNL